MFLTSSNLIEDTNEDYYVTTYKVNKQEIAQIRNLFADEAYNGAYHKSIDYCAKYVRCAFERAFKKVTGRTFHMQQAPTAHEYEPGLLKAGFRIIDITDKSQIQKGDVMIFERTRHSPWGHIQVWTGRIWVSDYRQNTMYPDRDFYQLTPTFYRYYGS